MITPVISVAPTRPDVTEVPRNQWRPIHLVLIGSIALVQALARAQTPVVQDIYWEARFGLEVMSTGRLPHTDTYSWSARGAHWIPNSWAWNLVLGQVYRWGSFLGFWILAGVLSVGLALATAALARRHGAPPLATIVAFIPLGFLAATTAPRAQSVSNIAIILLALLLRPLLLSHGARFAWSIVGLVVLQIAWINLHSMALLGPPLLLAGGTALVATSPRSVRRSGIGRLVAAAAVMTGCCLATPYGISVITHAGDVRKASTGLVTEWAPVGFGSLARIVALAAVISMAALAYAAWRRRRNLDVAAQVLLFCVLGATAIRFVPMGAVLATAELGLVIANLRVRRRFFGVLIGVGAVALVLPELPSIRNLNSLEPYVSPRLMNAVPSGCRVLNDDIVGGALILARPDVTVSLDGRNDLYGRDRIERMVALFQDQPGTDDRLSGLGVNCILGPTSMPVVKRLARSSQWSVRGTDKFRTLLVRNG